MCQHMREYINVWNIYWQYIIIILLFKLIINNDNLNYNRSQVLSQDYRALIDERLSLNTEPTDTSSTSNPTGCGQNDR
jgi:hypothetical protein